MLASNSIAQYVFNPWKDNTAFEHLKCHISQKNVPQRTCL